MCHLEIMFSHRTKWWKTHGPVSRPRRWDRVGERVMKFRQHVGLYRESEGERDRERCTQIKRGRYTHADWENFSFLMLFSFSLTFPSLFFFSTFYPPLSHFLFVSSYLFLSFLPSFLRPFLIIFLYMTCFKFLPIASAISIISPCFIVLYYYLFLYLRYKMSWTET